MPIEPLPFVMMMYIQWEEFYNFGRNRKEQSFKKDGIIKNLLLILLILFCLSWDKASHYSPGWPWSSCLAALAFWVPGWQARDTIRGSRVYYSIGVYLATYSMYAKYSFILIFTSFEWAFYHSYPTIRIWLTSFFTLFCLLKKSKEHGNKF